MTFYLFKNQHRPGLEARKKAPALKSGRAFGIINMTYIKASTAPIERFGFVLVFFLLTCAGALPLILLSFFIFLKTPEMYPPNWVTLLCFILGSFFGKYFLSNYVGIMDVVLSENDLTIGLIFKKQYYLNQIAKIVKGVPTCRTEFFGKRGADHKSMICANTLFIRFITGSFLTMNIHHLKNGTRLMEELTKRLDHMIDESYVYNAEEIKRLKKHNVNTFVK